MSDKSDRSVSGTVTMVLVSFDMTPPEDGRELTMEDIARLLHECLANSGESLLEEEAAPTSISTQPDRLLH